MLQNELSIEAMIAEVQPGGKGWGDVSMCPLADENIAEHGLHFDSRRC